MFYRIFVSMIFGLDNQDLWTLNKSSLSSFGDFFSLVMQFFICSASLDHKNLVTNNREWCFFGGLDVLNENEYFKNLEFLSTW